MRRTLVLLRHGRTAYNAERRAQGQRDIPLDDLGLAQAAGVGTLLAELSPVALWSSDLVRARQTAAAVAEATGLSAVSDERLREYDVGIREGMTVAEAEERLPDHQLPWEPGSRPPVPGSETHEDVLRRIVPAVTGCLSALEAGETGILVGHGASIRTAVGGLLGWHAESFHTLGPLANCHWAVLQRVETVGGTVTRLSAYNVGGFAPQAGVG